MNQINSALAADWAKENVAETKKNLSKYWKIEETLPPESSKHENPIKEERKVDKPTAAEKKAVKPIKEEKKEVKKFSRKK